MKSASLHISLSWNQILDLIRQLPNTEKIKLSKELEKELLAKQINSILKDFETDEIDEKTILEESDSIRKELYAASKGKS